MTNVQITNGIVKYGRTVKTGDYENKRSDVELSFTVPEGEDGEAAIFKVGGMAAAHCMAILGIADTSAAANVAPKKETAKAAAPEKARPAPKLPAAAEKPKVAADAAAVVEEPLDRAPIPPGAAKAAAAENKKAAESVDDGLDDLLGGPPAQEITDKELTDATQKCQAAVKNAPAIRKILNELGVKHPPGRIIDLPQAQRSKYLELLKEVKPLA